MANFATVEEANIAYDELEKKFVDKNSEFETKVKEYNELNSKYVKVYEKVFFEDGSNPTEDEFDTFCNKKFNRNKETK